MLNKIGNALWGLFKIAVVILLCIILILIVWDQSNGYQRCRQIHGDDWYTYCSQNRNPPR